MLVFFMLGCFFRPFSPVLGFQQSSVFHFHEISLASHAAHWRENLGSFGNDRIRNGAYSNSQLLRHASTCNHKLMRDPPKDLCLIHANSPCQALEQPHFPNTKIGLVKVLFLRSSRPSRASQGWARPVFL